MSVELVLLIVKMDALGDAAPMEVEGDIPMDRFPTRDVIRKAEKVLYLRVAEAHRGRCVIEIDLYILIRDAYGPKQAARSNARVEVVDLIFRGNCPNIEIQSNEAKGASMLFPVHSNVDPLHETGVVVEEEMSGGTSMGIGSCASTLSFSDTDKAVKIDAIPNFV